MGEFPYFFDDFKFIYFLFLFKSIFEFKVSIEMIFDGTFSNGCDKDDFFNTTGNGFLDNILNDGFINHREHFFWLSFRGGKETRSHSCNRNNSFSNFHRVLRSFPLYRKNKRSENSSCTSVHQERKKRLETIP